MDEELRRFSPGARELVIALVTGDFGNGFNPIKRSELAEVGIGKKEFKIKRLPD
jgi:hypothetical protein